MRILTKLFDRIKPIRICKGAYIGPASIILPGVTIGGLAVVGAGSVVTKSIPPETTVVGNPSWTIKREGRKLAPLEHGSLPDPVHKAIDELNNRIKVLEEKLK